MKQDVWRYCENHLGRVRPDRPVFYFEPRVLHATARRFQAEFPGAVTYAVKANPAPEVLDTLVAAGIAGFDVASPEEMAAVRRADPGAALHYHNPVRSEAEIAQAIGFGARSYSVDCAAELDKLGAVPQGTEIAVRLALPVPGAAYDFGAKFGADWEAAAQLLRAVAARGFAPAMTFHPGTQCGAPAAWTAYIEACAQVAREAGVRLVRLNVGGGFPARRAAARPDLGAIFAAIRSATAEAFAKPPQLVCEPGRAMVADAFTLALRVKAIRPDGAVFLNDGVYGALAEMRDIGAIDRITALAPDIGLRRGDRRARIVFGPTCDSLDRLPEPVPLPEDLAAGDYLLIEGMGAYASALATRFNGFGAADTVTLLPDSGHCARGG